MKKQVLLTIYTLATLSITPSDRPHRCTTAVEAVKTTIADETQNIKSNPGTLIRANGTLNPDALREKQFAPLINAVLAQRNLRKKEKFEKQLQTEIAQFPTKPHPQLQEFFDDQLKITIASYQNGTNPNALLTTFLTTEMERNKPSLILDAVHKPVPYESLTEEFWNQFFNAENNGPLILSARKALATWFSNFMQNTVRPNIPGMNQLIAFRTEHENLQKALKETQKRYEALQEFDRNLTIRKEASDRMTEDKVRESNEEVKKIIEKREELRNTLQDEIEILKRQQTELQQQITDQEEIIEKWKTEADRIQKTYNEVWKNHTPCAATLKKAQTDLKTAKDENQTKQERIVELETENETLKSRPTVEPAPPPKIDHKKCEQGFKARLFYNRFFSFFFGSAVTSIAILCYQKFNWAAIIALYSKKK